MAAWRELTSQWIALANLAKSDIVPESTFKELIKRVESPPRPPGCGWADLWLRIRYWGLQMGFAVPDCSPGEWTRDLSKVQCRDNCGFEGQLTSGVEYKSFGRREEEGLLQVANNQGRHRWYPASKFFLDDPPERIWRRKMPGVDSA